MSSICFSSQKLELLIINVRFVLKFMLAFIRSLNCDFIQLHKLNVRGLTSQTIQNTHEIKELQLLVQMYDLNVFVTMSNTILFISLLPFKATRFDKRKRSHIKEREN
jgi:hypothetical protein